MENKKLSSNVLSDTVMDNIQTLTDMSFDFYKNLFDNVFQNNSTFSQNASQLSKNALDPLKAMFNSGECCPPKQECPPHCIATLHRRAMKGERILVPFQIKNCCGGVKTYRAGIRELKDQDNKPAAAQPKLNKNSVTLQPNASERVLMILDLANFETGTYTAEIVVREKEYNQNICFTLTVGDESGILVCPHDEKKYKLKWQSWQSHYYCEPPQERVTASRKAK